MQIAHEIVCRMVPRAYKSVVQPAVQASVLHVTYKSVIHLPCAAGSPTRSKTERVVPKKCRTECNKQRDNSLNGSNFIYGDSYALSPVYSRRALRVDPLPRFNW
jgi:hypothetical protein